MTFDRNNTNSFTSERCYKLEFIARHHRLTTCDIFAEISSGNIRTGQHFILRNYQEDLKPIKLYLGNKI